MAEDDGLLVGLGLPVPVVVDDDVTVWLEVCVVVGDGVDV